MKVLCECTLVSAVYLIKYACELRVSGQLVLAPSLAPFDYFVVTNGTGVASSCLALFLTVVSSYLVGSSVAADYCMFRPF